MKHHLVLALFLAACGGSTPAPVKPTPPKTFACADKTCTEAQICIETHIGQGIARIDGTSESHIGHEFAAAPIPDEGGWGCTMVDAHHETCDAKVPAAPPHGG